MLFSEGESNRNCMHYKFNKMYKSYYNANKLTNKK